MALWAVGFSSGVVVGAMLEWVFGPRRPKSEEKEEPCSGI